MADLNSKKSEGFDRIPLRILNEGAELLAKPLAALFKLIYEEKKIPEQWRVTKIMKAKHTLNRRDRSLSCMKQLSVCLVVSLTFILYKFD